MLLAMWTGCRLAVRRKVFTRWCPSRMTIRMNQFNAIRMRLMKVPLRFLPMRNGSRLVCIRLRPIQRCMPSQPRVILSELNRPILKVLPSQASRQSAASTIPAPMALTTRLVTPGNGSMIFLSLNKVDYQPVFAKVAVSSILWIATPWVGWPLVSPGQRLIRVLIGVSASFESEPTISLLFGNQLLGNWMMPMRKSAMHPRLLILPLMLMETLSAFCWLMDLSGWVLRRVDFWRELRTPMHSANILLFFVLKIPREILKLSMSLTPLRWSLTRTHLFNLRLLNWFMVTMLKHCPQSN